VRYVGRSKYDTAGKRLKRHLWDAKGRKKSLYKCQWINSVQSAGGEIVATVLEFGLSWEESCEREIFYIAKHKSEGHPLTNLTDGGEGVLGWIPSKETRDKISAGNLGKIHSAEHRAKIGVANRGKIVSAESREKNRVAHMGIKLSAKTCERMSLAKSGKTHCKWGHEFNETNTRIRNKFRYCRTCDKNRAKEYRAKKRLLK